MTFFASHRHPNIHRGNIHTLYETSKPGDQGPISASQSLVKQQRSLGHTNQLGSWLLYWQLWSSFVLVYEMEYNKKLAEEMVLHRLFKDLLCVIIQCNRDELQSTLKVQKVVTTLQTYKGETRHAIMFSQLLGGKAFWLPNIMPSALRFFTTTP